RLIAKSTQMIGKTFDLTAAYSQKLTEVKKLLHYYFDRAEIKNKIVLDAGCRVGDYTQAFINMGARKVIGIDLSRKCLKTAKKRYKNNTKAAFYRENLTNLKRFRDNYFDAIFCAGTISYLNPQDSKAAVKEFVRISKPKGVIIVLFQKDKGPVIQVARWIANHLPLSIYLFLVENLAFLLKPIVEKIIDRSVSLNYLKYDILLSLRGVYFGVPVKINKKFRIQTIKCEQCSEETTASFKIILPADKKMLK
ncbi:MAG: class I SAM-dependent methyltransferase, partial [Patescibacteria group bacterium]